MKTQSEKDKVDENKETPTKKDVELDQQEYVEEKVVTNFGNFATNSNSNFKI